MSEQAQVSQESELHKEYDALYGSVDPESEYPPYWYWLETKVVALQAKLSKMEIALDAFWADSDLWDFDERGVPDTWYPLGELAEGFAKALAGGDGDENPHLFPGMNPAMLYPPESAEEEA